MSIQSTADETEMSPLVAQKAEAGWRPQPLSGDESAKGVQILEACKNHDFQALQELATSKDGFVEDEIRRTAWPVLLGCINETFKSDGPDQPDDDSWRSLPGHRDEEQVKLDVNRSFVYYPQHETETQLDRRKQELSNLITEILRRHPMLCYFQGYHDIVQVLLLVLGADYAAPAVAHLSLLRIRDFMLPTLSAAISHLHLLPAILECADPEVRHHLSHTRPFFALAATLTLYAHDIQEYSDIARLFDFLLAHEAVVSLYLFAIIIVERKDELLEVEPDEPEMLHFILSKLPQPLNLEGYITKTMELYERHPPQLLPFGAWRQVSSYSVLKTTRDIKRLSKQTLQDGEALMKKQAVQLRLRESVQMLALRMRKHQRPLTASVLTISVGLLSWWIGRNSAIALGLQATIVQTIRGILSMFRR